MEILAQKLSSWLKEQVLAARGKGVITGLSGGIDSSVVAALCCRAFPKATLGLILPCYSSEIDARHAQLMAQKFNIPVTTIALDKVFDTLVEILPQEVEEGVTHKLGKANIKPRLRMIILYYLANCLGYLVVGGGNRSELSLGYFTKYGDGGVDLLPLGNLVKSQIYELALYLNIPQEIINKPPSAGLWEGQTDEAELGLTYAELDRYLTTGEAAAELRDSIESRIARNTHKRLPPAIPPF